MTRFYVVMGILLVVLFILLTMSMRVIGIALHDEMLMFLSTDNRGIRLNMMDVDQLLIVRLMTMPRGSNFTISPDGQWIAYISGFSLVMLNIDSYAARTVTVTELFSNPVFYWSADSSRMAYYDGGLHVVEMEDWSVRTLTTALAMDLSWLPDNETLLYAMRAEGDTDIYRIGIDDNAAHLLIQNDQFDDRRPALSPDGRWLAFTANSLQTGTSVNLLQVDTGMITTILERSNLNISSIAWSADGTRLSLTGNVGSDRGAFVIDMQTHALTLVWAGNALSATWSPDDQHLLVYVYNTNRYFYELHLVNPDSRASTCLTCISSINTTFDVLWLP